MKRGIDGLPDISRRGFVRRTAPALALPVILSSRVLGGRGRPGANDRIRVGAIGVGNRSNLLIGQLPQEAEIVAVADCFLKRARNTAARRQADWRIYQDYRSLLEQKDIDGVIVGTPDHTRVLCSIHACQAGKDIYAEKPLTVYVTEGRALVRAARKYGRVFQVGSQQRSMAMNRIACEFVRAGGLGRVQFVLGVNYDGPVRSTGLPEEPVPEGFDWDGWLGPTPARPYNSKLFSGWMRWWDYSGGEMTNWGAHGLDQVQWALGTDETGPVEIWTEGERFDPPVSMAEMRIAERTSPVFEHRLEGGRDVWSVARGALGGGGSRWLPVRMPGL